MTNPNLESFQDFFNQYLNTEQQKAVAPKEGTLLVCAGAGSGKTRVITARIAHLILKHTIPADSIIALTFTNKAAKEMRERVVKFLNSEDNSHNSYNSHNSNILPFVGTFHSYCLKLLKQNGHLLSLPQFSLLDETDKDKLLKTILQKAGLTKKVTARQISSSISRIKNEGKLSHKAASFDAEPYLYDIYQNYEQAKKLAFCLDFDDLLVYALELFCKYPLFQKQFQSKIRHVLIDEYQDTNLVQHALLKAITLDTDKNFCLDSLCVVGDEDQSIYSWRGATVSNIINFHKDYPQCQSITIDQNYRSVQPILHLANSVITNNTYRNPKKLWSEKEANDRIRILRCTSSSQEGHAVAAFSKAIANKKDLSSCALLYRSHYQSRALEEALIRSSIPYKVIGGIQFYERQEIKDLLAYLRLIVNPYDRIAFSRIINSPTRGLGEKFEEDFYTLWDQQPFETFKDIAHLIINKGELTRVKQHSLEHFMSIFETLESHSKTSEALQTIVQKTNYQSYLEKQYEKEEANTKKENIKELLNSVIYFENQEPKTIVNFLDEVSLLQELNNAAQDTDNYIKLMTLHAAKGLEFDTVILTGLEEGLLPSSRSLYNPEALEEERRLLYVGLTRACERLLITHTRYRYAYGTVTDQRPSRFLDEFDTDYSMHDDGSYWKNEQFSHYFNHWLNNPSSKVLNNHTSVAASLKTSSITLTNRSSISSIPSKSNISYLSNTKTTQNNATKNMIWLKNQSIKHSIFGIGIIEKIELKSNNTTFITARFKTGTKKIDAKFLESTF